MKTSKRNLRLLLALLTLLALMCPMALAEDAEMPEAYVAEAELELGEVDEIPSSATETETSTEEAQDATIIIIDDDFELDEHDLVLEVGEQFNICASIDGDLPKLTSSDRRIATVASDGTVKGVRPGECTITATLDGVTDYCTVTVIGSGFMLDVNDITLGVGEKYNLYPAIGGAMPTFTTSNKKIATVSKDGTVKAVKAGECTITAIRDGEEDYCDITVMKAPKSVKMDIKTITLGYDKTMKLGESFDLDYEILPDDSWSNVVTLSGYSSSIVHVDDDNTVTAVGVGSTKIKVSTFNKKSATVKITVMAAPDEIEFNRDYLSMGAGSTYQLKVIAPAKTGANVTLESQDESVARIDDDGVVTAVAPGSTLITASCFNGAYAECAVDVVPAPTWIEADPEDIILAVGDTQQIYVTSDVDEISGGLTFTTSKKSYATVTADGLIKAVKKGKATITVKTYNNRTATVNVEVRKAPSSISLNKKTLTMGLGDEEQLVATLSKDSWGSYTFESSDPDVVEVDDDGTLYAAGTGKARITVRTFNKKTAYCDVQVMAPAAEINLADEIEVPYKKTVPLFMEVLDESGREYKGDVSVTFSPKGIVSFENGRLKGVKEGETVMTVTAGDIVAEAWIYVERIQISNVVAVAHRGGIGGTSIPENTLEAFEYAPETGADAIELDVHSTKDGVQVVNHDTTFYVGSKKYTIASTKFSDIRKKKPSIPTLDEALEVVADTGLDLHLELKTSADGAKCVKAVRKYGLEDRTIYFGFYETPLKAVYKAEPDAILGLSLESGTNPTSSSTLKKAQNLHIQILVTNKSQITESRVETLHDLGYEVCAWTPDSYSDIEKCIDAGVDYIISNYPERVVNSR